MGWQQPKRVDYLDCKIYQYAVAYRIKLITRRKNAETEARAQAPDTSQEDAKPVVPEMDKNISPKKAAYHF